MSHALVNINFCLYLNGRELWLNSILAPNFYKLISFQTHLHHLLIKNLHCFLFPVKKEDAFKFLSNTVPYSMLNWTISLKDMASLLSDSSLPSPACLPSHTMFCLSFTLFILLILFLLSESPFQCYVALRFPAIRSSFIALFLSWTLIVFLVSTIYPSIFL